MVFTFAEFVHDFSLLVIVVILHDAVNFDVNYLSRGAVEDVTTCVGDILAVN